MLKYIRGKGAIIGIPARNLSDDEVNQYGGKDFLLKTGLYKEATSNKKVLEEEQNEEKEFNIVSRRGRK